MSSYHVSHENKPALLSMKSWLFNRDPYNGLLNPQIAVKYNYPIYTKQPGARTFHCSCDFIGIDDPHSYHLQSYILLCERSTSDLVQVQEAVCTIHSTVDNEWESTNTHIIDFPASNKQIVWEYSRCKLGCNSGKWNLIAISIFY